MNQKIADKLESLPAEPGVYLMKDDRGRVIYVGKAVNLKNRVRSYFQRGSSDTRQFVALLDDWLDDLETVVVKSEKEALLLELELIKKHRPRFNVQLRDDKNFLCLRVDTSHPYPRLETVRAVRTEERGMTSAVVGERGHEKRRQSARAKDVKYFGPYASAHSIRETLRVVNRHFQLRTCTDHVLENRKRPCLLHQIGRCPAPCVFPIPSEEYKKNVDAVVMFLEGKSRPLIESLRGRMKEQAKALKFEEAARSRDQVIALERSLERQTVATTDEIDQDAFGFFREADRLVIYVVWVRGGRLNGGQAFHFSGQEFPDAELLESFLNSYYGDQNHVPKEVLLPFGEEAALEALAQLLSEKRGDKVRIHVPMRGDKAQVLQLARSNAERAASEKKRTRDEIEQVLERLKERLHLRKLPRVIECFDISHFQGTSIVASKVASVDGEPDKSLYRRFHLKTVKSNDDFASMYEVVLRRAKRGLEDGDLPDLMVIDGGKGQLAAAQAALKDAGVEELALVSLAKARDLEVTDESVKRSDERVFLIDRKEPIVLPQTSAELFVLTRLRDEAHRFAITFQRQQARKRGVKSKLDDVPGVGATRRKALLRHFGSLKKIEVATIEEIAEVGGIGPAVAEKIHSWLHGAPEEKEEAVEVRETSLEDASPAADG